MNGHKSNQMTITQAIPIIESIHNVLNANKEVVMIEMEDGSGMRFNYKLKFDTQPRFINLTDYYNKLQLVKQLEGWVHESFSEIISIRGKDAVNERIKDIINKF